MKLYFEPRRSVESQRSQCTHVLYKKCLLTEKYPRTNTVEITAYTIIRKCIVSTVFFQPKIKLRSYIYYGESRDENWIFIMFRFGREIYCTPRFAASNARTRTSAAVGILSEITARLGEIILNFEYSEEITGIIVLPRCGLFISSENTFSLSKN